MQYNIYFNITIIGIPDNKIWCDFYKWVRMSENLIQYLRVQSIAPMKISMPILTFQREFLTIGFTKMESLIHHFFFLKIQWTLSISNSQGTKKAVRFKAVFQ